MNRFNLIVSVSALSIVAVAGANAATITTWNVGSGQPKTNFLYVEGTLGGSHVELGLRAIHRQSPDDLALSGNTYTAFAGFQTAGEAGAPTTNVARNRWNFDYHIHDANGIADLDSVTMTITSPAGNTVTAPFFDMKLANNDNLSGLNPESPLFYIQDSQNPVFAPWFVPTFNMNVTGIYTFTLVATKGNESLTQSMNVDVRTIPTPGGLALLGLGGLAAARRRR